MKSLFLYTLLIFYTFITATSAQASGKPLPTVAKSAYNPVSYFLYLDYEPKGFFISKKAAYAAASKEIKRKASSMIQIVEKSTTIFTQKQYANNRANFLPWQIEIKPGCDAIYLAMSWEGNAEIALITPDGKRISQQDFGKNNPDILSYYADQGEDLLMLNPKPGIWQVWVLGKFKNAQINIPNYNTAYSSVKNVPKGLRDLTFASFWGNEYIEDTTPASLFLADSLGKLYLMESSNPKIRQEMVGYNGLAMKITRPSPGKWKLITLTKRPEINEINFTTFSFLPIIKGKITKLTFNKKTGNYLFYWRASPATSFPKVLFLTANDLSNDKVVNLIIPLVKNPQIVPASKLPPFFSYRYFLSSSFRMSDEGLNNGVLLGEN